MKRFFLLIMLLLVGCSTAQKKIAHEIFIRVNQTGFNVADYKSAIVLSNVDLINKRFFVIDKVGDIEVYSDFIRKSKGNYGNFKYAYEINFSELKTYGKYIIRIENIDSPEFSIDKNIYSNFASDLLKFFKVQRCGNTNPIMHKKCHLSDVTSIIENNVERKEIFDVTGGWHDAGDYTKFLNTTAFSTYLLLFSYDFSPEKFSFDIDNNSIPDILEEAKIGLDWLLRANYKNKKLVTQVQNEKDQTVGWRLPEDDPLKFKRPAFVGLGKNLIGIYVAALSLGARIWADVIKYPEFSERLKETAKTFYDLAEKANDLDTTGTGFYIDSKYYGKMALGSIELYELTGESHYLEKAKEYADKAGTDAWWGWGNVANIADYKIAKYDKKYITFLLNSLSHFSEHSDKKIFGEGVDLYWGSSMNILGVALINILYTEFTGNDKFNKIEVVNRDYILGRNPWGISFIYGKGENYTKHFHHQVAFFNGGKLPGALTGGPVMKTVYGEIKIHYDNFDKMKIFQSDDAYYRDDKNDYVSNEPTISANATAIFVFGNLK